MSDVDWDALEQSVRKAVEAVRMWPREAPASIASAEASFRSAREALAANGARADLVAPLAGLERTCRLARENLAFATPRMDAVQEGLARLRG